MARPPKTELIVADDLQDAVRTLTSYLQQKPLATAALLTLALAIGAGASSVGRRGSRKAAAPVQRRSRRRKGLGVAAFEFDQKQPDGRRTDIDFTWTGPKATPAPDETETGRSGSRIGVALFEFSQTRPGGKDTAFKFGWSKEPLEPTPGK